MSKRFQITETEIESIKKLYISEQAQKEEDRKSKGNKPLCCQI